MKKTNPTNCKVVKTDAKDSTKTPTSLGEAATLSIASTVATKAPTKADMVITMLRTESGTTIAEIMAATNWQAHSVRGFLSGTVRKKFALALDKKADEAGVRRYRIAEPVSATRRSERRRTRNRNAASDSSIGMKA